MVACLPLLFLMASEPVPARPTHKIDIHVEGPLALIEVWRSVDASLRAVGNRQAENTLDLNLPDKAALVDWEVVDHGERARMAQQSEGQVSAGLAAALKLRQLSPSTVPPDEGTDYRIHVTPLTEGTRPILHYRYSAPVACSDGKLALRVPESLEENPIPAEVSVTFEPHPEGFPLGQAVLAGKPAEIRPGSRRAVLHGLAPARAAWELSWSYRISGRGSERFPGQLLVAAAATKGAKAKSGHEVAVTAMACLGARNAGSAGAAPPATGAISSVILLVDRSRSVGQGGLSEERVLARAFLEALPSSVPFNAILFGQTATQLFPLPRMPTREALDAFSNAADPNLLEKGTDVVSALARVQNANLGYSAGATAESWVVIVTDGALPPNQTAAKMQESLAGKGQGRSKVLVLLVRQRGDDAVSQMARAEYSQLAARFGGLVREVSPGSASETVREVLSAMLSGGDWFDLRFGDTKLADALPAGHSLSSSFIANGKAKGRMRFSARGLSSLDDRQPATVQLDVKAAKVAPDWLAPLVAQDSANRRAWAGATSSLAVAVLPASPTPKKEVDEVVHGRIDETVLRNALSLAFMPRARACYLSRRVATADDAFLRGRVRLELTIERGELLDSIVRKSTLGKPEIEDCLRKAAWAVEYPRPEHRDALTVANLNLVFRPRTAEEGRHDASPLDREIELILGPLTFAKDFGDLLEDKTPEKSVSP